MNGCVLPLSIGTFPQQPPAKVLSEKLSHSKSSRTAPASVEADGSQSPVTVLSGQTWMAITDPTPRRWIALAAAKPLRADACLVLTDGSVFATFGLPRMTASQGARHRGSIWQMAAQAAATMQLRPEMPLGREALESLLQEATNLQLCRGLSSRHALEAAVRECWRLGLPDLAGQLLQRLAVPALGEPKQHKRKNKRSHAAMLGLHGLPELAMAMPRSAHGLGDEDTPLAATPPQDPRSLLLQGNEQLLKGDLPGACSSYEKAGPEGWLPLAAVLVHAAAMADVAALLRNTVYQALTTLHERPRPAASFSSLSPQFRRPTSDRAGSQPSPPAIRAAAALALSIGCLAAALLAIRRTTSSPASCISPPAHVATSTHPHGAFITGSAMPAAPFSADIADPSSSHTSSHLDRMYPDPQGRHAPAVRWNTGEEGWDAAQGTRASTLRQGSSLARALSRPGKPSLLPPGEASAAPVSFPDPLYWRLDSDHRAPTLPSLKGDDAPIERRVALETKQILQVLSEQRNGGIANPQLACGLLLFGQELPGGKEGVELWVQQGGKEGVELWVQQGSWQHALRLAVGCADAAVTVHGPESHLVLDTRDWAASTLDRVVADACQRQAPGEARSTLFAAHSAACQLDEGVFDIKPLREVRSLCTALLSSAMEGLVDRGCELHKRLPLLPPPGASLSDSIHDGTWRLLGQVLAQELKRSGASGEPVSRSTEQVLLLCEGISGQPGLAASLQEGLKQSGDCSTNWPESLNTAMLELGDGLQNSEMVSKEQWEWATLGAATYTRDDSEQEAAQHEACLQADMVVTFQTALVLAEPHLPARTQQWARETTAEGPRSSGETPLPDTPVSPRDHGLPWESCEECVPSEESKLGWEVLHQAAALAASSHGQSTHTTRQLLHGACASLRSISQEQMDFMAVNQLQPLARPMQADQHLASASSSEDDSPDGSPPASWWPRWAAHVQGISEGLTKWASNASTVRMMRRTTSAVSDSQAGMAGCVLAGLEGISSSQEGPALPFLSDCFKHPLCIGLDGRETEGEAQCALLSLCGERVRGGVLTWEAARLKAALQLSNKRGGPSGLLRGSSGTLSHPSSPISSSSPARGQTGTPSPLRKTSPQAAICLPSDKAPQRDQAPTAPSSALRKTQRQQEALWGAPHATGDALGTGGTDPLSPSAARKAWKQLESLAGSSDASSGTPLSKAGSGRLEAPTLQASAASAAQPRATPGSPRRIPSGPIPRNSKTGLIRAYTPMAGSPSALPPLKEEAARPENLDTVPELSAKAGGFAGRFKQALQRETAGNSHARKAALEPLQQIALEEDPDPISSEILLEQRLDEPQGPHVARTRSSFTPASSRAAPPRMRASADVPQSSLSGTLRQRYSLASGTATPASQASSPGSGSPTFPAFALPSGLAPLKVRLPEAPGGFKKPWLTVEPVQHGSFTRQRSPNSSLHDIKLGMTALQPLSAAGPEKVETDRTLARRPVAEARELVEGSPAWAIDQLLTEPDSRLYATAAVASSSPNLQVHLDNLPEAMSPSVDEVFSPLSSGLHRLQLEDTQTVHPQAAQWRDNISYAGQGSFPSSQDADSLQDAASDVGFYTPRQGSIPDQDDEPCSPRTLADLQMEEFWAGMDGKDPTLASFWRAGSGSDSDPLAYDSVDSSSSTEQALAPGQRMLLPVCELSPGALRLLEVAPRAAAAPASIELS
ncbi:hypothetical protein WJX84_001977 [Apatococcus fuscideae]|uniref:Protein transport protein sec16 n=1 Tax=Apatococcus fuscideae TaxID=2026836 RepID=A0AAW1SUJ5_9CHLO